MLLLDTMPQPVKLSDPLVQAARAAAQNAERSLAGQIEHWARLGRCVESTLSADAVASLKRGVWPTHAVHTVSEPSTGRGFPPSSDATAGDVGTMAPLAPRLRRGARRAPATGFPIWLDQQRSAIEALCRRFGVRRLAFFGSVLRADFHPAGGSDVDASVEFHDAAGLPTARQYFDFKAALEQHLQREVDLVELDAMPETRLKRIIARTQQPFYVEAA